MEFMRFYSGSITRPVTEIGGTEARHLVSVMRLKKGDKVEVFDGKGSLAKAVIEKADIRKTILKIEGVETRSKRTKGKIIIVASIAKGERFDWLVSKCTELGVDEIVPVVFERTVKKPKNPKISQRWCNITISAAKQCKRLFLPEIAETMEFSEAVKSLRQKYSNADVLFGSLKKGAKPLIQYDFSSNGVVGFVGPEGGITEAEEELLKENGAELVKLTDTVLRIETAGLVFAALLCSQRDFNFRTVE